MRAVIFDLDGVVVNTAKYHYLGWKKLAKELGFDFDISHNERLKGVSRMESLNIVLEVGGITGYSEEEKQKLADRKNRYYLEMIESIDGSEILPGIPVWKTGDESKFPGTSYVIFPGNVGDDDALLRAVEKMQA